MGFIFLFSESFFFFVSPGPQGPKFYQNSGFWWFGGVQGGLGVSPIDAGSKITLGVLFSWDLVGVMKVSCRFLIFDESLGYAYSCGFKPFSIKSAFEPITPTLKWVLADGACKVSVIFSNIASIQAGKCKMVPKHWFLLKIIVFATSCKILLVKLN